MCPYRPTSTVYVRLLREKYRLEVIDCHFKKIPQNTKRYIAHGCIFGESKVPEQIGQMNHNGLDSFRQFPQQDNLIWTN